MRSIQKMSFSRHSLLGPIIKLGMLPGLKNIILSLNLLNNCWWATTQIYDDLIS
uniref:Uncharacterized protein n=1 Tax=Lepeophtheirus salmonis TaxID=72036 RepID=A0A0K2TIZ8_LEPSM